MPMRSAPAASRLDRNRDTARWLDIVRGEYLDMPGLTLTLAQAARLWGRDQAICAGLLNPRPRIRR